MSHRTSFGTKAKIILSLLVVAVFAGGYLIGTQQNDAPETVLEANMPLVRDPESSGEVTTDTIPFYGVVYLPLEKSLKARELSIPVPDYIPYSDRRTMVHDAIRAEHLWIPQVYYNAEQYHPLVTYASDRYFSIALYFQFRGEKVTSNTLSTTYDLESAHIIYLHDLVDVEGLADYLKTSSTIKMLPDAPRPNYVNYPDWVLFEDYSVAKIQELLSQCSVAYDEQNGGSKPSFYLGPGRLYFANVLHMTMPHQTNFFVDLDDIEHLLKVDKW